MSRWRRSASNALMASSLGLLTMLLGSSAGCEFLSRVDRAAIPNGNGGGGSGGGAGGDCTTPQDCPGTDTVCRSRTCTDGVCGFADAPQGTATENQTAKDCLREVCDGAGTVTTEPDDTDILDDGSECTTDLCVAGVPQNMPLAAGAFCASNGGKKCDGMGSCVECASPSDCMSYVCTANQCVSPQCVDAVMNGSETDTDCGGPDCAGCADGKACDVASDCASKVCLLDICQIPTCSDGIENGTESDKDCGGSCTPCGPGLGCGQDMDCIGGSCSGSVCLETCTDNLKNGNETDVDCGGPTCSPCGDNKVCSVGSDCGSKICTNGACVAATCMDQVQNGAETGVDCGGMTCTPCADGSGCNVGGDCTSGVCTGMVCQVPTCMDSVKNGAETDVDCGGGSCGTCDLGKACAQNGDCTSNICVNNICVDALCGDGQVTGSETCDDGNASSNDGCSSMCAPEMGYTCTGLAPSICTPICNDNKVVPGEPCDDGNATDGDGCSATCAVETGYACTGSPSTCTSKCGDGVAILNETCDDGNIFGGDGCSVTCTIETGFTCAGTPSNCTAICGDSKIVGFEGCDDGNINPGDGCDATCNVEMGYGCSGIPSTCSPIELEPNGTCADSSGPFTPPFVISGRLLPLGDEDYVKVNIPAYADLRAEVFAPTVGQCPTADPDLTLYAPNCTTQIIYDDLDGINLCPLIDSTVDTSLRNLAPGTYYLKTSYYLNGNTLSAYQVQVKFNALCGNGVVEGSETCDDGNTTAGDGCATNCRIEPKPEVEPNNACGQATGPFALPVLLGGAITPTGDQDLFSFTLPAYADIKVQTFAPNYDICNAGIDTVLQLRAPDCTTVLTTNDNGGVGTCSLINSTTHPAAANMAPGTYYIRVEENGNNAMIANYQVQVTLNALCGDGIIQGTETCDDGNSVSNDGCANNCRLEQGWTCTGTPNVCTFLCGNGAKTGTEQCDDGNTNPGDGCSNVCLVEPGYICSGTPSMCMMTCGNSAIDGNDLCDDGNSTNGDGCSSTCVIESNYNCTGTPSMCTHVEHACNDGMDNDGDSLSDAADPDCQIPAYFPACGAGQSLWVFKAVDTPKAIPDYPGVGPTTTIGAGLTSGNVVRAAMLYNITHTWDSDLDLSLIPPGGTSMDVCSDNGSSSPNFTNTVLDSTCSLSVVSGSAPFTNCYQPEVSFSTLAGKTPTGFWKFQANDDASGDVGTINSWAMIFCTTP